MSNTLSNIYEELCSYENLELAFRKARRRKTLKDYVLKFEENVEENLLILRDELLTKSYNPKSLQTFILRDPKTRKISKSDFRDRIIHHAICNLIEPVIDKTFLFDSYANRKGKGPLNAIKRFDEFKRKVTKNNTIQCYVLKADIKSYFESINHKILMQILSERIKDENVMWLIKKILTNHKSKELGKGMPLGNLTSQFFANVYLNELDQYVKHKLRIKYYIRYVDDFVIVDHSKKSLEMYREKIDSFLRTKLNIYLHPEKSKILKLEKGVNFLGFRVFYHHKLLTKKNLKRFEKKLGQNKIHYQTGKIEREEAIEKLEGWLAYATNANTYKYRKRLVSKFNSNFPTKKDIPITSVKKHENFNKKIEESNLGFTLVKTLQLFKNEIAVQEIARFRKLREGTIWDHIAQLIENHHIQIKEVMPCDKVRLILNSIKSLNDKLKDIKVRINDNSITYNQINCVLSNVKGKYNKKSINYFVHWYLKTNCRRKCQQKKTQECRIKFQQLVANSARISFTKKEFLDFFNNQVNICTLPDEEKRRFVKWKKDFTLK